MIKTLIDYVNIKVFRKENLLVFVPQSFSFGGVKNAKLNFSVTFGTQSN